MFKLLVNNTLLCKINKNTANSIDIWDKEYEEEITWLLEVTVY